MMIFVCDMSALLCYLQHFNQAKLIFMVYNAFSIDFISFLAFFHCQIICCYFAKKQLSLLIALGLVLRLEII